MLDTSTYQWVAPVAKPSTLPAGAPYIELSDDEQESLFNSSWGWAWNEQEVAWQFNNFHDRSILSPGQRANVEAFIATIEDVS